MARAHRLGGRGVEPRRSLQLIVRLWEMTIPNGTGSQAAGTGSLAQQVVAAQGAPEGDGLRGWCPSMVWAHDPGRHGVPLTRWSGPIERMWGIITLAGS